MTDATGNEGFQPDEVEATRGREQGLGVGERELQRQRDVGDVIAAPEEVRDFQSAAQDAEDAQDTDQLDENTSVLGVAADEDDTGYTGTDSDGDEDGAGNRSAEQPG